jgi:hypothetical protein
MENKNFQCAGRREHHPRVGIGMFFVVLGLALMVATNDLLNLGSVGEYFTWETALIFIGVLLLLNLQVVGGLLLVAGGTWFFLDNINVVLPDQIRTFYWPAVLILLGLGFILMSAIKKRKETN